MTREEKVFEPLEWLAAMGSHVPDKGKQMMVGNKQIQ